VFSGLVLLLSHPFGVGDAVNFRSGAFGGEIEGMVTEIGITYVRIETAGGNIRLPNSQVLASAVGPAHQDEPAGQADHAGQVPAPADQAGQVPAQADQARQAPTQAASGSAPAGPSAG
jgi:hypothetical protein